jgi:hypothetical protein
MTYPDDIAAENPGPEGADPCGESDARRKALRVLREQLADRVDQRTLERMAAEIGDVAEAAEMKRGEEKGEQA